MASNKYVKLDPKEHVLARPGMYIGSLDADDMVTWVFDEKMEHKQISYVSGLYKIYDEIVVNALDHVVRCKESKKPVKEICVNIDEQTGVIEVYNSGEGIEVEMHKEHKVYIPELVFGNMLTSTNYDDTEERVIGGQNGIGAKACNIFSTSFVIETVDSKKKKLYRQEFTNNMKDKSEPEISSYTKYPYTKITFLPDYKRFKQKTLSADMCKLMVKRVYDICALTANEIKVSLNNEKIDYKNFEKYVDLYLGASRTDVPRAYVAADNGRWEVCVSSSANGFKHVSFVNGINTLKGGKHVDYITNQLTKKLCELITKRKKVIVKANTVKDHLFVFIKSTINNPTFDSQTKEYLTTPYSKFGSKFEIDDKLIEKIYKFDITERIVAISSKDDDKNAKKTDGKKKCSIRGIPKLDDANWAGTSKSNECILILTEGDSAKSMAISGLSEVGRNKYGVFPLKGKIMNVKDTNVKKVNENEEIANLKKIIGLESNKEYNDTNDLRYGHIMVLTDADTDGSHIKGLLFNLFHTMWPSLMKIDGFMMSMLTPIVKVTKGKQSHSFYNLTSYDNWKEENDNGKGWEIKYYKGLGTSTNKEAKEYFKSMNTLEYSWDENKSNESIELAFNKKRADDRKDWLYQYDKQFILDELINVSNKIEYSDFIHRDLIHFSNYNIERSIPSICDGFKKSLRKIMYSCLKRKLYKEIKVAQLAGYVSEHGAYHHGEASLHEAIIGMAQNFVGSNNINLLMPNGQFGTRIQGGKDSASPRYIHTELNSIVPHMFHADDFDILDYLDDDGIKIEPSHYIPIIPMILVNGSVGIGTGFSTNIPCYNPKDIIRNLRLMMDGEDMIDMNPWYQGFKGTNIDGVSKGVYKKTTSVKVEVTELPIGYWTEDFKNHLESYMEKHPKVLRDYESHYTEKDVKFVLHFHSKEVCDTYLEVDAEKNCSKFDIEFKMQTTRPLNTSNMHLYTKNGNIKKYNNVLEIIKEFYDIRLEYYVKRKLHKIKKIKKELKFLDARILFIDDIITEKLRIFNNKKQNIVDYLTENEYPLYENSYDFLTRMPIHNLTFEKKEELQNECDTKHLILKNIEEETEKDTWRNDLIALEKKLT
ncbi:DNA topoisomerase 2 [Pyramimonas orientalis virus]|uniref:DNA topoisomerase 2 n=1 Tax=Pyramimonas orientalis virus 01B TaxID=3134525 RepID=A0A7L9AYF5_9VIRU|nr:DNA topoisomerase 2 [Pyramimonas orientalis virus]QOI90210.1 DNA topoisomerase 2 [Pyramimonas orientalis virus]